MSDLDADLYGDLYGDDNEFSAPAEQEPHVKTEDETSAKPAASAVPSVSPSTVKQETPPLKTEQITTPLSSLPNVNAPQPIQSYSSTPQDYSTRRNDQDFRPGGLNDALMPIQTSSPIVDRHVRPSEMKEEGKMFIGGLNWDTTDDGLRKYFEQFGKVEACTIMRDSSGRSRCFAFLTFEEPASVNAVMVREHYLDGKIIDPKRAIPRQEHQRAQKLFIGGLPGHVTSDSMREFFSKYGKVIDSTVMLDRETGRSKGFGFISFENANVEPILGFGKLEIDGKLIDIKLAQPRHQRDGGGYQEDSYGGGQGGDSSYNSGSSGYSGGMGQNAPASNAMPGGGASTSNTPFDPQALAALYTRMFQQFGMGGGGMGGMSGGGMGNMGGMGAMGNMMGGMNRMGSMGMMGGATGAGAAAMMGRGVGGAAPGGMIPPGGGTSGPINAPRGPRGTPTGPQAGVGPQRTQRGHGYHPYSR